MNESDILFENIYTDTLETLEEMNQNLYAQNQKHYTWIFGVFSVIFLLLGLLADIKFLLYCLVFLSLLIYYRQLHKRAAKQQLSAALAFYDGEMPTQIVRITEDTLYYINGCQSFCVPLRKLSRATVTKNGLIIRAGYYFQFYLSKNAFTRGTYEDFLEFLKEKCPSNPAK